LEEFHPPRTATDRDVLSIVSDPRVPELLPMGWGNFSLWEKQAIGQFLKAQGIDRSLQEIFFYYTANHVNFVFPSFFVSTREHDVIPYSIQKTALVCSACVELFGILGESHLVKYLAPCPGLKYVKPPEGTYLRAVSDEDASSFA